jgi:hypothetical protein
VVHTSLPFPALQRLLQEVRAGATPDELAGHALLELEVRYASPFTTAVRAALLAAIRCSFIAPLEAAVVCQRMGNGLTDGGRMDAEGRRVLPQEAQQERSFVPTRPPS